MLHNAPQVTEQYSFARETSMARRDLRSGQQTARAALEDGGVRLSIRWGEPNAGVNTQAYLLECQPLMSPRDALGTCLHIPLYL